MELVDYSAYFWMLAVASQALLVLLMCCGAVVLSLRWAFSSIIGREEPVFQTSTL
ncbi:MAG: hypothetical protein WBW79_06340 [Desulfocapsaceae bacterium]